VETYIFVGRITKENFVPKKKRITKEKRHKQGFSLGHQALTLTSTSKQKSAKISHLTLKNGRVWQKKPRNTFPL